MGDELRRVRRAMGLTQRELADRVGVHPNSIARQERGELGIKEPLARLIRLLATATPNRKRGRKG
jgi:transcriptional regulator with XRE-family HTH domain